MADFEIENGVLVKYTGSDVNVIVPNNVIEIGRKAFYNCRSLKTIVMGRGVTKIGENAFEGCDELESIVIGKNVATIEDNAFSCCEKLANIVIPNSVTRIGELTFTYCKNLVSIAIGSGLTTVGDFAFSDCGELKNITYVGDAENFSKITFGAGNNSLTDASIKYCDALPKEEEFIIYNNELKVYNGDGSDVVIPDGVIVIGDGAFNDCVALTSVDIPACVEKISKNAFAGCSKNLVITIHKNGFFRPKGYQKGWNGKAKVVKVK